MRIREDVAKLATAHGRRVGTPGHDAARKHLVCRLTGLGINGYASGSFELPYQSGGQDFVNLVAQLPGADPALSPVLLAAHYDTCGDTPVPTTMRQRWLCCLLWRRLSKIGT